MEYLHMVIEYSTWQAVRVQSPAATKRNFERKQPTSDTANVHIGTQIPRTIRPTPQHIAAPCCVCGAHVMHRVCMSAGCALTALCSEIKCGAKPTTYMENAQDLSLDHWTTGQVKTPT